MNRRDFAGAIGAAALTAACRRPAPGTRTPVAEVELVEASIADLQAAMTSGRATAEGITSQYLGRMAAIDRAGPALRSIIEVNPEAETIARARDGERKAGRVRGPLHGIPVVIKDNIDTADRMMTSAGSLALADHPAPADADLVQRLRDAGAVLLGKTNLSEWANFRSTRSSSGWSGRGGQTRNPYVLDRNPCGSSSGTGAAIAASLAAVGVGTETDGSVVCPSNACGLVGLKPTLGFISGKGIVPISHSQDTAGPMARTVRDAMTLMSVLAPGWSAPALDPGSLKGARLGVARQYFGGSPDHDAVMEQALVALSGAGAVLVDPADIPSVGSFGDAEYEVLLYEFRHDLEAYLASRGPTTRYHTLAELIAFNSANASREMPWFGQEIFEQAVKKGPLTEAAYRKARTHSLRRAGREGIDAVIARHRLDAIVCPTGGPAWVTDWVNGDHFGKSGDSSSPAAVAGYPHVTVPAGSVAGLPVGLSFMGPASSDARMLQFAFAFEQATKTRRAPTFVPTIGAAHPAA